MYLEQLRYFTEVIETKSMNRAAQNLYLSQSTLSTAISSLENELGVKLLKRSNQGVIATEIGEKLYHDIQQILYIIDAWQKYPSLEMKLMNTVKVAVTPTINNARINQLITMLLPQINMRSYDVYGEYILSSIPTSEYNIVISYCLAHHKEHLLQLAKRNGLRVLKIEDDELGVLLSKNDPLAEYDTLSINDLKNRQVTLLNDEENGIIENHFKKFFSLPFYHVRSTERLIAMTLNASSITFCPLQNFLDEYYIKNNLLLCKPIADFKVKITAYIAYMRDPSYLNSAEKLFISHLEEIFGSLN